MSAPDPHRAISIVPDQIWRDKQITGRRVLVRRVEPDRVYYVPTYSATPGLAGFAEILERMRKRGGVPPSMKRSRWKSCFFYESGPTAIPSPVEQP